MDLVAFLAEYDNSFATARDQELFLFRDYRSRYPSLHDSLPLIRQLLSLDASNSSTSTDDDAPPLVRHQLLGVKLLLSFASGGSNSSEDDKTVASALLFDILVQSSFRDAKFDFQVYSLVMKHGLHLLDHDQITQLLFGAGGSEDQKQLFDPSQKFINQLVKSIAKCHEKQNGGDHDVRSSMPTIDESLLMRVAGHPAFSNDNLLVLLSGVSPRNHAESDDLIVRVLLNGIDASPSTPCSSLRHYGPLVRSHPRAILKYLATKQQLETKEMEETFGHSNNNDSTTPLSYDTYVAPSYRLLMRYETALTQIARMSVDLNREVLQLIQQWFIVPMISKFNHLQAPPRNVSNVMISFGGKFTMNNALFLDMFKEARLYRSEYLRALIAQFNGKILKHFTLEHTIQLIEMMLGDDFDTNKNQANAVHALLCELPFNSTKGRKKVDMLQSALWKKHGQRFEDWIVNNFKIGDVCYLIPDLGNVVAERLLEKDRLTVPDMTKFEVKCQYTQYMKSSVEQREQLEEFKKHCSNPSPETRATILCSLLLCSLYHQTNMTDVLSYVTQRIANERTEFMDAFLRRLTPLDYRSQPHNTISAFVRANAVRNEELLSMFKSLLATIGRKSTHGINTFLNVISYAQSTKEDRIKLTHWAHDVLKNCTSDMVAILTESPYGMRYDNRSTCRFFDVEVLARLLSDQFVKQVSQGKFSNVASFIQYVNPLTTEGKRIAFVYREIIVPSLLSLSTSISDSEMTALHTVINNMHHYYTRTELNDVFVQLIESDPTFIFCRSVQRWALSKRTPITYLQRYLALNDNCTITGSSDLKTMKHSSDCKFVFVSTPHVYLLNPHVMREQRIEKYVSESVMCQITKMLVNSDRLLMQGELQLGRGLFIPTHHTNDIDAWLPPNIPEKRILQFAARMQVENREALRFRELVNSAILTLPDEGVVVNEVVISVAVMSRYLTSYRPNELIATILQEMKAEHALHYYCALLRCSTFQSLNSWIDQLCRFITERQLSANSQQSTDVKSANWGITLQKILFSWFKTVWTFKTDFNHPTLIPFLIQLFHSDKTHKDTKCMIAQVLLKFMASRTRYDRDAGEESTTNQTLRTIVGALQHEYDEIPKTIVSLGYHLSFKNRELHDTLLFNICQLLSHEKAEICEATWATTLQGLSTLMSSGKTVSKSAMNLISDQCVKQLLTFDPQLEHGVAVQTVSVMYLIGQADQPSLDKFLRDGLTPLITDQRYIEMDYDFNVESNMDQPRYERISEICGRLYSMKRKECPALFDTLSKLFCEHEPQLYATTMVSIQLSEVESMKQMMEELQNIVHNICSINSDSDVHLRSMCAQSALKKIRSRFQSLDRSHNNSFQVSPIEYEELVRNLQLKYESAQASSSASNANSSLALELWTCILYIALHVGLSKFLPWKPCELLQDIRRKSRSHSLLQRECISLGGIERKDSFRGRGRGRRSRGGRRF